MLPTLNLFLLSFGALQGLLLTLFLLRKKARDSSRIYFSLFLIAVGLQLTFKVISKSWLWQHAQLIYLLSYSLTFLIGPLIYLFVRSRIRPLPFQRKDLLHFVPFFVHMSNTLTDAVNGSGFLPALLWKFLPWPTLDLISLFVYTAISWKMLPVLNQQTVEKSLRRFLILVVSAETVIVVTIMFMVRNFGHFSDVRPLFIVLTILIYWISYQLISLPATFLASDTLVGQEPTDAPAVKYANSGLKPAEADRIAMLLETALHQQKIFLESEISIQTVAEKLDVPKHHLSQVINEQFGMTYTDLANHWRLEEARSRLANPKFHHLTIAAIALDSGFSSVSSFTTMFKRQFRVTPSAFRKQNHSVRDKSQIQG